MGRYKIVLRKSVAKDLRRIPNRDLRRILITVDSLSEEPRPSGIEKLSEQEKHRIRQGNYRIIYEIDDDKIIAVVVKVVIEKMYIVEANKGLQRTARC
jgi:mRNA interferase RelE/StbE